MLLQLPTRTLDLGRPRVMGILNVTPDSFSDGGRHQSLDAALRRAEQMLSEGASLIDVGGESTRPGSDPVSAGEEIDRVLPVIEALRARFDCVLSVDTMKAEVMDAACACGAELINDVNALRAPGALEVAARRRAAVCLMHMQGEPRSMQQAPRYADVVVDVNAFLAARAEACRAAGVAREAILLDPGFGFGKTLTHNLALLGQLDRCLALGYPVLVGLSRKSMFGQLLGLAVDARTTASASAAALSVWQGARIVRAHDVRATREAIEVADAARIARSGEA